ncbi:MAG: hypothetical protein U0451_03895 [Candidatus Saccharimonadales bacterium]
MNKSRLSRGDMILTKKYDFMLVISVKKENDSWLYYCRNRLKDGNTTEHFIREQDIKAVCPDPKWSCVNYLNEVGIEV